MNLRPAPFLSKLFLCLKKFVRVAGVVVGSAAGALIALLLLCCECSDHQQLSKLIQESPTAELKENLECELEVLVGKMEAKASQITKVRKYQAQVTPSSLYSLVMAEV